MTGRIVKAVADFYYIYCDGQIHQCKAKGIFRKRSHTPLVGDEVEFELTHAQDIEGNIISIAPRKSQLSRPTVANVDLILLVFAIRDPWPNFYLLDRFLAIMENIDIETVIVFNKIDLDEDDICQKYKKIYETIGYKCILSCTQTGVGLSEIKTEISERLTSVAGPSGVGKSSIINALTGGEHMETGQVSVKNKRGKQTTRHTELLPVGKNTFIVDTPGFSSTDITHIDKDNLGLCFPEFSEYLGGCKFSTCSHISEPNCSVKQALLEGKIYQDRYDNYVRMYEELKSIRQY